MLSRRSRSLSSTASERSALWAKLTRTRKDSKPTTKNKSTPARTLVITAKITTKRLFHKTLSNDFFHEIVLTTREKPFQHPNETSRLIRSEFSSSFGVFNAFRNVALRKLYRGTVPASPRRTPFRRRSRITT